jgi:hypothetical protein
METLTKALGEVLTTPVLISFGIVGFLFFGAIGLYERRHR